MRSYENIYKREYHIGYQKDPGKGYLVFNSLDTARDFAILTVGSTHWVILKCRGPTEIPRFKPYGGLTEWPSGTLVAKILIVEEIVESRRENYETN